MDKLENSIELLRPLSAADHERVPYPDRPVILPPTITIPPLACSQPLRQHPSYASIRDQVDAWLLSVVKPPSTQEAESLVQSLFSLLACAVHVEVEESLCLAAAKYTAWLFVFDDITDDVQEGLGAAHPATDTLLKGLNESLGPAAASGRDNNMIGRRTNRSTNGGINIAVAERHQAAAAIDVSQSWWSEMCARLSPAYQTRFRHNLQRFAAGAAVQVAWRQAGLIPDLYTYIANRRDSASVGPSFVLLEAGLGLQFDPSVLDCPLLTLLRSAVVDHVAWVNDIFSFKSEYVKRGDVCNILAVVWLQPSSPGYGDLQKSVDIVSKMIEQRDRDFAMLLKQAQGCRALMEKPGMDKYLRGLADWISGNLHWYYATTRYYDSVDLGTARLVNAPITLHLH